MGDMIDMAERNKDIAEQEKKLEEGVRINTLQESLKINKHDLDTELMAQPEKFFKIGQEYAEAVSKRDHLYELIKQVDAELDVEIRQELEDQGKKATEKLIDSMIKTHKEHIDIFEGYIEARKKAEELLSLKEAFSQRAYMLRDLASLYISGYYSDSSVGGASREQKEEKLSKKKETLSKQFKTMPRE